MPKRPSVSSTRARQRDVVRYVYSTNLSVASRHYGVSPKQLDRFISTEPKRLKGRISRSPAYTALYRSDAKQIARAHDIRLVPRLSGTQVHRMEQPGVTISEKNRAAVDLYRATRVRVYRKSKTTGKVTYGKPNPVNSTTILRQAGYQGYSTIASVEAGYRSGQLSREDVTTILDLWRQLYGNKSRTNFDALEDSILELEVDEEVDDGEY